MDLNRNGWEKKGFTYLIHKHLDKGFAFVILFASVFPISDLFEISADDIKYIIQLSLLINYWGIPYFMS